MKGSERVRASASRSASRGTSRGPSRGSSRGASRGVWKLTERGLGKSENVRKGMQMFKKV